jgi:nucleoside-diphosphate-sugar epimerase
MKVLITGATGFIGSHLAELLFAKGYELRCPVRKTSDLRWLAGVPFEKIECDLASGANIERAVEGVDFIYHLAGVTKAKTKEGYYQGNQIATRNLLEATLKRNPRLKRFIHISSQTVSGPSLNGTVVNEETPCHPITTYGLSKYEAEKECRKAMSQLPITIVRPPTVYGPRDKDVFEFFNTMKKGLQPMVGMHDKYVSMIHVKDLVRGIVLAGEHPDATGKTYFISSEKYYNWKEVGAITAKVMGKKALRLRIPEWGVYVIATFAEFFALFSSKPALINFEKARDMVQDAWTCDTTRARTELGFKEEFTLEEGIKNTVEWYKKEGWL